ncbi:MAG: hypothetical protein ABIO92_10015 [Chloroflexia bacterium]
MLKHIKVVMGTAALARRVAMIALLSVLAVSLAACGGDSGPAAQATVGTAQTEVIQKSTTESIPTGVPDTSIPTVVGEAGIGVMDLMTIGDPCFLLTKDDVEGVLGPVDFKTDDSARNQVKLECVYVAPTKQADGKMGGTSLTIAVESTMNWIGITMMENIEPVEGVGDGAYTYIDEDGLRSLWTVVRGKVIINVLVYPTDLEKAKQLATKIIAKLP